jgi:hypothetical protein
MKATFVKDVSENFIGTARLYRVDPPIAHSYDFEKETYTAHADFIVSSAVNAYCDGPETYLFAADENGKILDWSELEGSFRGGLDCDKAIRDAGYEL